MAKTFFIVLVIIILFATIKANRFITSEEKPAFQKQSVNFRDLKTIFQGELDAEKLRNISSEMKDYLDNLKNDNTLSDMDKRHLLVDALQPKFGIVLMRPYRGGMKYTIEIAKKKLDRWLKALEAFREALHPTTSTTSTTTETSSSTLTPTTMNPVAQNTPANLPNRTRIDSGVPRNKTSGSSNDCTDCR